MKKTKKQSLPKPRYDSYHSVYLDTVSINEAERMIDYDRLRYREAMNEWWSSLTPKQKNEEKKRDDRLIFYIDNLR